MYESYFGLREKPFSILPDPRFLYFSRNHQMAFSMLEYGIINQAGFTVVTGAIAVSYTHLRAPRDRQKSRMPSSA